MKDFFDKYINPSGKKYSFVTIKLIINIVTLAISLLIAFALYPSLPVNKWVGLFICAVLVLFITVVVSSFLENLIIGYIKKKNF